MIIIICNKLLAHFFVIVLSILFFSNDNSSCPVLFPFSFKEYLLAKKIDWSKYDSDFGVKAKVVAAFSKCFLAGGFPLYILSGKEIVLKELYENILYKDIIKRFGKNEKQLRELSSFFLANPSSKFSFRNISGLLGVKNRG
ncbi:ATP-binding protein, partial [Candidatus Woesearchaeota archaeon]|nr:ATP-binding protein [Candidatus Woesearchaeota archaeon]